MSWQTQIGTIVRHLINDVDIDNPTYSDERIETSVLVATQLLLLEVDFEQTYTVNVETCTLTPDPTSTSAKDDSLINLAALRAACLILGSELKTHSLSAVRVSDGPSSIDMTAIAVNMRFLYEDLCNKYEQYKFNFQSANNNAGEAIISPYSPGSDSVRGYYYFR